MMQGYIHMSALALGVPPSKWRVITHAKNSDYISVKDALKILNTKTPYKGRENRRR